MALGLGRVLGVKELVLDLRPEVLDHVSSNRGLALEAGRADGAGPGGESNPRRKSHGLKKRFSFFIYSLEQVSIT
jgi:hypothetical protein